MSISIYTYPNSTRTAKALIAAQYNGVEIKLPEFQMGVDNKKKDFLAWNPMGKVPTAVTEDGPIFESSAIMNYVIRSGDDVGLAGSSNYDQTVVDQWVLFCDTELALPLRAWLYPIFGYMPENKEATKGAKEDVKKLMLVLNKYLQTRTFLVGNAITAADIAVVCTLKGAFTTVFEPKYRKQFKNVTRWFETCVNQKEFAAVLGEVTLCEKMAVAKAPEAGSSSSSNAEEKPKSNKKAKNPLDLLPPSDFDLDDFKRLYQNSKKTRVEVIPKLWETFDDKGFSMYICEYMDADKYLAGQMDFQVTNLINGFYQRLDRLHRYGFGSMLVFGPPKEHTLSGAWIFRGDGIPAEVTACDDSVLYSWTRVDPSNEELKTLFEDYLCWDGELGGRGECLDGKIFV
eukprot:TRINITY_DN277_c1_g1_i2.p1 TRINITY_DN277_c1_g1~~TRINITY_DN277_c1_g1_i2.p1  ORF type:complete len:400 (+),score=114.47 TRINITY_DN277_c1_g1_i2:147-1346(+)